MGDKFTVRFKMTHQYVVDVKPDEWWGLGEIDADSLWDHIEGDPALMVDFANDDYWVDVDDGSLDVIDVTETKED